jgi:adenylate kinase family enzyme
MRGMPDGLPGRRFAVTGAAGVGKSTVARALSSIYGIPHIDLDDLYNRPGWRAAPVEEFRRGVAAAIEATSGWVIDGRYHHLIEYTVWEHADTLVWLDLPARVVLPRLLRRQSTQILLRQPRSHGDVETWRRTVTLMRLSIERQRELRRLLPELLGRPPLRHLAVVHLQSDRDLAQWLDTQRSTLASRSER